MRRLCVGLLLALGCTSRPPAGPTVPPGLAAIPPRLAYLCVTPGCEETQTAEIAVRGSRRVAIKRILLSGGGSADFSFVPSETPPFIVGGGSSFTVDVTYKPRGAPAPGEARLLVTYTDASPEESPDRLAPGEISIPLVRRIVGEPFLTVRPGAVQFGVVSVGDAGTRGVRVANEGFGNLVLEIASIDAGHPDFQATLPAMAAMGPDAGFDLPIVFRPTAERYVKSTLTVFATAKEVPPARVTLEGTSLSYPRLAIETAGDVDFGLVPKTKTRTIDRQLVNQGGVDLVISAITVIDVLGDVKLVAPLIDADAGVGLTLRPLERVPLSVLIDGVRAGEVDATIEFSSNDPATPLLQWHVAGTVTDPKVQLTPPTINFGNALADGGTGNVPVGWVINKPLEIMNVGYGPLTVKNIVIVSGGSSQFALSNPTLPATLDRNARLGVDVQFTAATIATFAAEVSVETDDVSNPFAYAQLRAGVGMCGPTTCPIANGTSSCSTGTCQVGMCNSGYYDTDLQPSTGCECREIGTDPGAFCMGSYYAGNLTDESSSATSFTGLVARQDDVDLIVVHGEDQSGFFSDAYDVKIRLDSSDPGIRMCVYHHKGGHDGNCYFSDETCPGNRQYRDDGSLGPDDGADYVIKVFRDPQNAATCTAYTVFMSNGR